MFHRISKGVRCGVAIAGTLGALMLATGSAMADDVYHLNVAGSDGVSSATPFFVAQQLGYFKDAGLDVTYLTMAGSGAAMAAAIAVGDVDVGLGAASQYMGYIANGAVKGKLIGEFLDNNYVILGGDGITDVTQLRGKRYGISSANAGDHIYSMAVLSHYGIKPDEMEWIPLGSPPARLSALISGKVDGIEMTITSLPEREEHRVIVSADDSPIPFVSAAIFATDRVIKENPEAMKKFLAAIGKASDWIRANPDEAVEACMKSGSQADRCKDTIRVGISSKNPFSWSSTSRLNVESIEGMLPNIVEVVPKAAGMTLEDFVDTSLVPNAS